MGRYGRDSYDARYGMERYGSGGLEQPHEATDDEADDEQVSCAVEHPDAATCWAWVPRKECVTCSAILVPLFLNADVGQACCHLLYRMLGVCDKELACVIRLGIRRG